MTRAERSEWWARLLLTAGIITAAGGVLSNNRDASLVAVVILVGWAVICALAPEKPQ